MYVLFDPKPSTAYAPEPSPTMFCGPMPGMMYRAPTPMTDNPMAMMYGLPAALLPAHRDSVSSDRTRLASDDVFFPSTPLVHSNSRFDYAQYPTQNSDYAHYPTQNSDYAHYPTQNAFMSPEKKYGYPRDSQQSSFMSPELNRHHQYGNYAHIREACSLSPESSNSSNSSDSCLTSSPGGSDYSSVMSYPSSNGSSPCSNSREDLDLHRRCSPPITSQEHHEESLRPYIRSSLFLDNHNNEQSFQPRGRIIRSASSEHHAQEQPQNEFELLDNFDMLSREREHHNKEVNSNQKREDFLRLLDEERERQRRLVLPKYTPKMNCKFCKNNGESPEVYTKHRLHYQEKTMCPLLRHYVCRLCNSTGDFAHTIRHCPFNNKRDKMAWKATFMV